MTQDPVRLGRLAVILLWVWFATDLLLALASLEQIGALGGFAAPIADQRRWRARTRSTPPPG